MPSQTRSAWSTRLPPLLQRKPRLLLLQLLLHSPLAIGGDFSWKDCASDSEKKISFESLELTPDPLHYQSEANISGQIKVTSTISSLSGDSEFEKKILLIWTDQLKDCPNHFGTCHYGNDACDAIQGIPGLCEGGFPCKCPIEAGTYDFSAVKTLPKNQHGYFGTGSFYYKLELKEEEKQIGCLEIYLDIEDKSLQRRRLRLKELRRRRRQRRLRRRRRRQNRTQN